MTDTNSAPLEGTGEPIPDPPIDPAKDYRIIGFVEIIIYDADIGKPPPEYQVSTLTEVGTEPFPQFLRFQEPCNNVRGRITCESKFVPTSLPEGLPPPRLVLAQTSE